MAYTKVHAAWEDDPSTATPIDAAALDQIEDGIAAAHDLADGILAVAAGVQRSHVFDAATITDVAVTVQVAPVGAALVVELRDDGTLVATVTVPDGATEARQTGLSHAVVAGSDLTVDITQVGSTTPGAGLDVAVTTEAA